MYLFLAAALIGVVVGWGSGGRLRRLANVRLRAVPLVWIALALQFALYWRPVRENAPGGSFGVVLVTLALLGAWLGINAASRTGGQRAGLGLIAAGWLLNALAIVPNRGMPVSLHAVRLSGVPDAVTDGYLFKHVPATSQTTLRWLGDTIPLPNATILSIGDVLMLAGLITFIAVAMRTGAGSDAGVLPAGRHALHQPRL